MPKNQKLLLWILSLILISIVIFISWYTNNGWWVKNPAVNDRPTAAECTKDFKEGITTIQDVRNTLGKPYQEWRTNKQLKLDYRLQKTSDRGCTYGFDESTGLLKEILTFVTVG